MKRVYVLHPKYQESHSFAFFLHDILVGYIKQGEKHDWFLSRFKFRDPKHLSEMEGLEGEELLDWLENNGYCRVVYDVYYRMVLQAVISDFCHFIYEGLKCSEKGKLAVAFSLFRKPFKDNLFIFEWLLVNPIGFLEAFITDSHKYAPDKISKEEKRKIMHQVIRKIGSFWDDEFLWELRYDSQTEYSLENLWNPATHLVTTHKPYKTETTNLNFIFSGEEEMEWQWDKIYTTVPHLLFYTVEVVERLMGTLIKENKNVRELKRLRRQLRFILWSKTHDKESEIEEVEELFCDWQGPNCLNCNSTLVMDKQNILRFAYKNYIVCKQCKYPFSFSKVLRSLKPSRYSLVKKLDNIC